MAVQHSRIAQAIRAIVLSVIGAKKGESLDSQQSRGSIPSRRGIGYMLPDGLTAGGLAGESGVTQLPDSLGNLSDYKTNEELEALKKADNEPKSITQILGARPGDKALAINGLMDCATGKAVEIVNTPEFRPPEGWDSPDSPGEDSPADWDLGFRWQAATFPITFGATAQAVVDAVPSNLLGGPWVFVRYIDPSSIGSAAPFAAEYHDSGSGIAFMPIEKTSCTVGVDTFCPASFEFLWPADNKMQLARGPDGKFAFSEHEPVADIIPEYTDNQHTKLELCFADGSGRRAVIEPTYDGGWMAYETDPVTGEPIGTAVVYNASNEVERRVNYDEVESFRAMGLADM